MQPPPAALGLAGGPDAGQLGAQRLVLRELVEQAALEPPAVAEEAAVVQRHVLGLGHLHRHGLEAAQVGRAAELAAAGADAILHLRHVAGADLPHLDAGAELPGQVPHQLAEVDPGLGREEHGHAPAVARQLDVDDLQREPAAPGPGAGRSRAAASLALAAPRHLRHFFRRRDPEDPRVRPIALELRQVPGGPPDLADGVAARHLDEAVVAHVEREVLDR